MPRKVDKDEPKFYLPTTYWERRPSPAEQRQTLEEEEAMWGWWKGQPSVPTVEPPVATGRFGEVGGDNRPKPDLPRTGARLPAAAPQLDLPAMQLQINDYLAKMGITDLSASNAELMAAHLTSQEQADFSNLVHTAAREQQAQLASQWARAGGEPLTPETQGPPTFPGMEVDVDAMLLDLDNKYADLLEFAGGGDEEAVEELEAWYQRTLEALREVTGT